MRNFSIQEKGQSITTSTSSVATLLAGGVGQPDVMLHNTGTVAIYVRAGGSGVVADSGCMQILPGEKSAYYKGESTHLATLAASGTPVLMVFAGTGI